MQFQRNYDDRTNIKTHTFSPHTIPEFVKHSKSRNKNKSPTQKSSSFSNLYLVSSPKSSKDKDKRKRKRRRSSSSTDDRRKSSSSSSNSSNGKGNISSYEVLDTVGCGSFAKVSRVRRKSTKEIFVWKELSYGVMNDKEKQMLCDEVNILRDLSHPNIVKFVDRIIDHANRKIYIVQEYCDGGDLASYIKLKKEKVPKNSGRISESFIWSVTSEIASALQHCHNHFNRQNKKKDMKKRILHRDLKPGNVFLIKRRGSYSVKLGDFGLAKMLDESSVFAQTHVGTPYYMSPEQIQSKDYNEKSDIWSLGCIVYEMAMLSPPFKAANYWQLAEKIKLGVYKNVSSRNYSMELETAISMMLKVNSRQRARVEDLLCLQRIQYTLKILRLDRRYCQLKKKEYEFNVKMKLLEDTYKKEHELKLKEHELKLKEHELKVKEHELKVKESRLKKKEDVILSSPIVSTHSSHSNNSISNNNNSSNNSNNSTHSANNSGSYMAISPVISSSYSFVANSRKDRTNSFQSIHEKCEKKDESQTNSGDELCHDHDSRGFSPYLFKQQSQHFNNNDDRDTDTSNFINLDTNNSNISNFSTASDLCSGRHKDVIINEETGNCLMQKINLSDLNENIQKFNFS